jgi:glutamate carboxypeptidase
MAEPIPFFKALEPQMVQWLTELVSADTPSGDKAALDRFADRLRRQFQECGAEAATIEDSHAGNHLLVRYSTGSPGKKPILILGHLDTVWPSGEASRRPVRIDDGKIYGPGALDMRGGLTLMMALAYYRRTHTSDGMRPVTILLGSDEETGSRTSRHLIESEALKSELVLVLEPCLPGGALKTFRKGVGVFKVSVHGVAAHAGVDYARGVSAIRELAHQIGQLYQLNDPGKETTVNVGMVHGGTRPNVIADHAEMEVDVRVASAADGEQLAQQILGLKATQPGARLEISGGINRPPLERTPQNVRLFQKARQLASDIGISLTEGATGGGSDGCFTSALGVPTLDGLGPDGDGSHALHEHVIIESLVPRAALLTQLTLKL